MDDRYNFGGVTVDPAHRRCRACREGGGSLPVQLYKETVRRIVRGGQRHLHGLDRPKKKIVFFRRRMRFVCLSAFRCASARAMFARDSRYIDTMRDKDWRARMESIPNWSWKQELRKLRLARSRDAAIIRLHTVSADEDDLADGRRNLS